MLRRWQRKSCFRVFLCSFPDILQRFRIRRRWSLTAARLWFCHRVFLHACSRIWRTCRCHPRNLRKRFCQLWTADSVCPLLSWWCSCSFFPHSRRSAMRFWIHSEACRGSPAHLWEAAGIREPLLWCYLQYKPDWSTIWSDLLRHPSVLPVWGSTGYLSDGKDSPCSDESRTEGHSGQRILYDKIPCILRRCSLWAVSATGEKDRSKAWVLLFLLPAFLLHCLCLL